MLGLISHVCPRQRASRPVGPGAALIPPHSPGSEEGESPCQHGRPFPQREEHSSYHPLRSYKASQLRKVFKTIFICASYCPSRFGT